MYILGALCSFGLNNSMELLLGLTVESLVVL